VTTQKAARTMALDPKTHRLFTVTANVTELGRREKLSRIPSWW